MWLFIRKGGFDNGDDGKERSWGVSIMRFGK